MPGVYLALKGVTYPNNSVILITEIGETSNGLQCITDRMSCCRSGGIGVWQDSDGNALPTRRAATLYRNRGDDDGTVNLNRPNGVTMPTGRYCCVVPDATSTNIRLCATIGLIIIYFKAYKMY